MKPIRLDPWLLIDAIRARWRVVAIPLVVVPLLAVTARFVVRPKMKASALVLVQERTGSNPILRDLMIETRVTRRIQAVGSIVRSSMTLERALRELGEITEDNTTEDIASRVESFRRQVDVYGEGGGLIRISIVGRWANRVYDGLNILTEVLIEEIVRPQTAALEQTVTYLGEELARVSAELDALVEEIRVNRAGEEAILPELHKVHLESYSRVSSDRTKAESELVELEEQLALYAEAAGTGSSVGSLATKLAKARSRLRKLKSSYTDLHPEVAATRALVSKYKAELKKKRVREAREASDGAKEAGVDPSGEDSEEEASGRDGRSKSSRKMRGSKAYRRLVRSVESLEEKVEYLADKEDELLVRVKSFADRELTLAELERERDVKEKVYASLLERFEDAKVTRSLAAHEAESKVVLIEKATKPQIAPVYSLLGFLIVGLFGGLMVGVSLVVFFEFFDRTVRMPYEAEEIAGVPVLATLRHGWDGG